VLPDWIPTSYIFGTELAHPSPLNNILRFSNSSHVFTIYLESVTYASLSTTAVSSCLISSFGVKAVFFPSF
ncbi:hypothetical protein, partial [Blautia schinkii]|uniref:hypothetical protein n=1 Tax=Blautia schinkii TaxID=180164 RepID=UPI001A9A93EE